jgi:MFS family permease
VIPRAACLFGIGLVALSRSYWFWLSIPVMFVTGLGMMLNMAASNTILQTIVDENKRGRVMSLYTMAIFGMMPFGSLLGGALANRIGSSDTLAVGGTACIMGAVLFYRALPGIREQIRPIYLRLGIMPEVVLSLQAVSQFEIPPED